MKHLVKLFSLCAIGLVFFACKVTETEYVEKIVEKEKIVEVEKGSDPLKIELSAEVPRENGYTGTKSNTYISIIANITTASTVKRVVGKKKNGNLMPKNLLADTEAIEATADSEDNTKWIIKINATDETANSTYTVAAIDKAGREETEQITIEDFDFTPPAVVLNFIANYSSTENLVTLNWDEPSTADFDHVTVSYAYNDGTNDSEEILLESVEKGTTNYNFTPKSGTEANAQVYTFYVRSVDLLGNKSILATRSVAVETGASAGYRFHDQVEYLTTGTDGTFGTSGTYVYFGDWPQTIKSELVNVDESQSMEMGGFTYYKGSDDCWYAKVSASTVYDSAKTFSDGTEIKEGDAYYFKVEPIKWRVLSTDFDHDLNSETEGKTLLLAESILTVQPYYGNEYKDFSKIPTIDSAKIYPCNYKYSNVRAYINGTQNQFVIDGEEANEYTIDWTGKGFLQSAFREKAQSLIETTTVDNSVDSTGRNPVHGTTGVADKDCICDNTNDKIFLLSMLESDNDEDFFKQVVSFKDETRVRSLTDYTKLPSNYSAKNTDAPETWWLRSPWTNITVHFILSTGAVDTNEDIEMRRLYYGKGIVPALCVSK